LGQLVQPHPHVDGEFVEILFAGEVGHLELTRAHPVAEALDDADGLLDAVAGVSQVLTPALDAREAVQGKRPPLFVAHGLPKFERLPVPPERPGRVAGEREGLAHLVQRDGLPASIREAFLLLDGERLLVALQRRARLVAGDVSHPRPDERVGFEAPVARALAEREGEGQVPQRLLIVTKQRVRKADVAQRGGPALRLVQALADAERLRKIIERLTRVAEKRVR
jgi:hypothetical protein